MFLLAFAESAPVQLVPDGTVLIHVALILLMIFILNRTFFKPINRILEAREKNKGGRFGEAESLLQEVSEKEAKYTEALRDARSKGYELIEQERSEAMSRKEQTIGATKEEAEQKLSQETSAIETQTAEARQAVAAEAEKMAEKISANILRA